MTTDADDRQLLRRWHDNGDEGARVELVERTLERKSAAMAELEGRPGQRRLTETLLRKLLDFARRRGLGHPITSLRSLFP